MRKNLTFSLVFGVVCGVASLVILLTVHHLGSAKPVPSPSYVTVSTGPGETGSPSSSVGVAQPSVSPS